MFLTLVTTLAIGASAWPNLLECNDDSYSRLKIHSKIMGGQVKACEEGKCPVSITVLSSTAGGNSTLRITTTAVGNFAVRVNDGVGSLSSPDKNLKNTKGCTRQMITDPGTPAPMFPGHFDVVFMPAAGKTFADAVFTVGFASGAALPGIADGVAVLTFPPTPPAPAPAPKPKGTPEMSLVPQGCSKKPSTYPSLKAAKAGTFVLRISVSGEKGFAHNCTSNYDPAVAVADKDCTDWLPKEVMKNEEGLNITLEAFDADGKQQTCMLWELTYDGKKSAQELDLQHLLGPELLMASAVAKDPMTNFHNAVHSYINDNPNMVPHSGNTSREARIESMHYYLDSMTHVSHRCVPKGYPKYFAIPLGLAPVFPPTAPTEQAIRLSHALLSSTGTVWSIDRVCLDAWYINGTSQPAPGGSGWQESCVPTLPGFPHCHVNCKMTWHLGPGGVASWGRFSLSHHIPAPTIALVTQGAMEEATYGNLGCGQSKAVLV
jgi:hypothetical protein